MNRLTEAMKRAGNTAIPLPASTAPSPEETFSPEEVVIRGTTGSEDALARVPAGGRERRARQDRNVESGRPRDRSPVATAGLNKAAMERLAITGGAPPIMSEEYRRAAAALHHAQMAHGTRVLMVTSACPGEGKTLTSANLALTLSQSYERRVLLIDADLRKPALHNLFDVENVAGLVDALRAGAANIERPVPVLQVTPRLQLLLSGGVPRDPMSLLTSDALRALLKDSAEVFDWVIVDTPPAAFLPDCKLLSSLVDAALLVVRAFVTPYPLVQQVVDAVGHDKVLGVVLNHAEHAPNGSYYYDYAYYGGYVAPTR